MSAGMSPNGASHADMGTFRDWRKQPPTAFDRERFDHWRASWVPDGWEAESA